MRARTGRRIMLLAVCGFVALAWFAWLRPVNLGGDASYIIVRGTSMEPTYHDGDLVIARRANAYRPGDVVVFRVAGRFDDPAMVIHRIVGGDEQDGYVTRGDNRERTDPWRPRDANVLGRASFSVPHAGGLAETIAQPWAFAVLGAAVVLFDGSRRRRRRRAVVRRRQLAMAHSADAWVPPPETSWP